MTLVEENPTKAKEKEEAAVPELSKELSLPTSELLLLISTEDEKAIERREKKSSGGFFGWAGFSF